jgi:hypothetical protein
MFCDLNASIACFGSYCLKLKYLKPQSQNVVRLFIQHDDIKVEIGSAMVSREWVSKYVFIYFILFEIFFSLIVSFLLFL